jgi:hypothetical protein
MHMRHTQYGAHIRSLTSKALVNRAFHKVVNSTSTRLVNKGMHFPRICMAHGQETSGQKQTPGTNPGVGYL